MIISTLKNHRKKTLILMAIIILYGSYKKGFIQKGSIILLKKLLNVV